jgi:hypothetical protein
MFFLTSTLVLLLLKALGPSKLNLLLELFFLFNLFNMVVFDFISYLNSNDGRKLILLKLLFLFLKDKFIVAFIKK